MTTTDHQSEPTGLDLAIASLLDYLSNAEPDSNEYKTAVDQLVKLYNLKKIDNELLLKTLEENRLTQQNYAEQNLADLNRHREDLIAETDCRLKDIEIEEKKKELSRRFKVTPDTLAIVAGNLIGIAVVVGYERAHVLTSKAFANVLKTR